MGPRQWNDGASDPYPGQGQRACRCPFEESHCSYRMDPAQHGGSVDICRHRQTPRRLVCFSPEPQTSSVLHQVSSHAGMGHRRTIDRLGGHVCLCLPTYIPSSEGNNENRGRTLSLPPHCPFLAKATVVPPTDQASGSTSNDSASQTGHNLPASVRSPTPRTGDPPPDLLALVQCSFETAGLPKDAATMAAQGHRVSTFLCVVQGPVT